MSDERPDGCPPPEPLKQTTFAGNQWAIRVDGTTTSITLVYGEGAMTFQLDTNKVRVPLLMLQHGNCPRALHAETVADILDGGL